MDAGVESGFAFRGRRRRRRLCRGEQPSLQPCQGVRRFLRGFLTAGDGQGLGHARCETLLSRRVTRGAGGGCLGQERERVVRAESLEECSCRRRQVVRAAHHDRADEVRRQRLRRGSVEARAVEKASLLQSGFARSPEACHEAQALGVGRGGRGGLQVVRAQVRPGEVLDRPQRRRREARGLHCLSQVVRSALVGHGLRDRAEKHGQADVLGHAHAPLVQQARRGHLPGQLVGQHELDGHVAGVPEDRPAQPDAQQVVGHDDFHRQERVAAAQRADGAFEAGAQVHSRAGGGGTVAFHYSPVPSGRISRSRRMSSRLRLPSRHARTTTLGPSTR